jgi:hypothetical protein
MKQDLSVSEAVAAAAEEEDNQILLVEILSCSDAAAFHFSLPNVYSQFYINCDRKD